jgi:hypothetical protein
MAYELYAATLKARSQPTAKEVLTVAQCKFHAGISCIDVVFILKRTWEKKSVQPVSLSLFSI